MATRRRAFPCGPLLVLTATLAGPSLCARARADEGAAALPPPPLTLSLIPGPDGGRGPWTLRITNTGELPVRITADPRLLDLELTPPAGFVEPSSPTRATGATRATRAAGAATASEVRCALPADARPATDDGSVLVLPAKRSWSQAIDPLFYCFGARERARLVRGATVKARFGWAPRSAKGPPRADVGPRVAVPLGEAAVRLAPIAELEAAPVTLGDETSGAVTPQPLQAKAAPDAPSLSLALPAAVDAARGAELATTVTVANDGDRPAILLLRPETLRFELRGPGGAVSCVGTRAIASPIRELYTTLAAHGRASLSVLLTTLCPAGTFDEPGVYRVTGALDTTGASARAIGLASWDGVAAGQGTLLVRVRAPRSLTTSVPIPALDALSAAAAR